MRIAAQPRHKEDPPGAAHAADDTRGPDQTHTPDIGSEKLKKAVAKLRKAAAEQKAEVVCVAYQAMRSAANGMKIKEMFDLADESLGIQALDLIVSAYARRECFMCSCGTVRCNQCNGAGRIEQGRLCPHCDGSGAMVCGFCRGTAWADRDTIPPELKRAVIKQQLGYVRHDLQRLIKALAGLTVQKIRTLPAEKRRAVSEWLRQLQARLADLIDTVKDKAEQDRLAAANVKINACLKSLTGP